MAETQHVAILGAGSIGCFVGGAWQAAGLPVTFVGRKRIAGEIARHGLALTSFDGWTVRFSGDDVMFATNPAALAEADLIAVTVKGGATAQAAADIKAHARPGVPVLSLQNGIRNIDLLNAALEGRNPVIWGMVPYNVVHLGEGRFHKGVAGNLWAEDEPAMRALRERVGASPAGLTLSGDMPGVAWGKLLINLNNAVNALSGRTLVEQLGQRGYRRVLAATMNEALSLFDAAGIRPAKVGAVGPRLLPWVMRAPDWLFANLFMRGWKIDAHARSSMSDDLIAGRATEIDILNGEIVGLAEAQGRDAPANRAVARLIREAEGGGRRNWGPEELRRAVLG